MIVRWKPKDHYKAIASWFHARELPAPLPADLPEVGFIVDNRVAGWIYRTDSTVAFIDGIISNPNTLPSQRRQSLQVLAGVLVDYGISLGYRVIIATSSHPSIQELAPKYGLKPTDQKVYILVDRDDQESDSPHDPDQDIDY